ncbi:hypothetical protein [Paracoccus sp. (in: a-proteobacteria)]|uniref:hypothetical protein n=1 Tax=Paracoccus sp. TaxID=267 RepID=UPI00321F9584
MPRYDLTTAWSDPIAVQAGDVVQNAGDQMILICAATPAADTDAIEVLPNRALSIVAATAIRARSANRHGGACKVVRGL